MKKIIAIILIIILNLSLCGCSGKEKITEDSLLYLCGAKTIQDIEKIEFIHQDYQNYQEGEIEITQTQDFEIFKYYKYQSDFPSDRVHELHLYPTNRFTITVNEEIYRFYLQDNGSLTYIPTDNTAPKTYTAENNRGITKQKFNELIVEYDILK